MQVLQAVGAVVLATLLSERAAPSGTNACLVERAWSSMYRAHDGDAVRRVQDALVCCGFNSLRDRAFPFQAGGRPSSCPETYGRAVACREGWTGALRAASGVELAVVLVTEVLQVRFSSLCSHSETRFSSR